MPKKQKVQGKKTKEKSYLDKIVNYLANAKLLKHHYAKFTVLGLFLLTFFVVLGTYFFSARSNQEPEQIKVSTISSNSFTVTFFTEDASESKVLVSLDSDFAEYETFYDERDTQRASNSSEDITQEKRTSHYIVARGLEPESKYYYKVKTNGHTKYDEVNFNVLTSQVVEEVPVPNPIFGEVVDKNNEIAGGVIVDIYARSNVTGD